MKRLTSPLRIQQTQLPMVVRRMAGPLLLLGLVVLTVFLARSFGVTAKTVPGLTSWMALAIGIAAAFVAVRFLNYLLFDVAFRLRRQAVAPALLRQLVPASLFDSGRAEPVAPKDRAPLSDRIARFLGIGA